ncbi:MBOAT family protein [Caulobacter sp. 17J80-11]|uniref:MBOAT family O-acyltransferase n=1 Tax=Caulobacter sp. 17J80-11 TaxID=2763502 RepID=UPI001653AA38|nr:MBOAT family protein [Caulobacter sp. 17J80-11]MBC6982113.1 MBOAT family protein [Caulobacter sp. 17J80-11]
MLFTSPAFLFLYLPIVFAGFFLIGRWSRAAAAGFLALASLVFYGAWDWRFVPLLLGSIAFNWLVGSGIARLRETDRARAKALLVFGVVADLAVLGFYKYADFFIGNVNAVSGGALPLLKLVLPLGVSFFTFTQIAFLVDAFAGKAREYSPVHYGLFVTYFPHLIAGPILHHGEMMPQFRREATYRISLDNVTVGALFFVIGLFKKVVLADAVSAYADPVFDAHGAVGFADAWTGALAYTLQLYFDFSGYCDMAVGLSKAFNIDLPFNFASPYKSGSIVEFWRRWHMTLSRFLRDYVYIPLGGNRKGPALRSLNLLATMLIGGFWHGAGWTFVVWGGLHGLYLLIAHAFRSLIGARGREVLDRAPVWKLFAGLLTFLAVVVAWVFFRAADLGTAWTLVQSMFNPAAVGAPELFVDGRGPWLIAALLAVVWLAPNSQQLVLEKLPRLWPAAAAPLRRFQASFFALGAVSAAVVFLAIVNVSKHVSAFIYFNF